MNARLGHEFALRGPIRRILVQRPRALGDILLATPTLRALREGYPQAALDVAVEAVFEPLVRRNPHVDRVWTYPRRGAQWKTDAWRMVRALRQACFDLVIDLHGSPRTAWASFWSGARNRVGYALRGRGRFYNFRVPRDSDRTGRRRRLYAAQTGLEIAARCGVRGAALSNTDLVFVGDAKAEAHIDAALERSTRPLVGVAPAGTWQAKTYPVEAFAASADRLARSCDVMVLWGPGEKGLAGRMLHAMHAHARLAPETNLDELAAVLRRLDLLVCNDSGVKHLAVACGTPTLTLFGPTSPRAWMPEAGPHTALRTRLPCLECNLTRCTHHLCMRALAPEWVAHAALEILESSTSKGGP